MFTDDDRPSNHQPLAKSLFARKKFEIITLKVGKVWGPDVMSSEMLNTIPKKV